MAQRHLRRAALSALRSGKFAKEAHSEQKAESSFIISKVFESLKED